MNCNNLELNKVFYDILLKFAKPSLNKESFFILEHKLISKYFSELKDPKSSSYLEFETYFSNFYDDLWVKKNIIKQ